MHKILITLLFCLSITQGKADHFNTDNLFYSCKQDTSFWSSCYSYLGGMKDLLGFFIYSSPEKRAEILCLMEVPTKEMVETISKLQLRESDPMFVADFLIAEFCD